MTISKELLNAVLNVYVCIEDMNPYIQDNMVIYDILDYKSINTKHINIYELALKCKEWAYKQGYFLSSGYDVAGGWCLDRISNVVFVGYDNFYTEFESIFKACQWILDNIED